MREYGICPTRGCGRVFPKTRKDRIYCSHSCGINDNTYWRRMRLAKEHWDWIASCVDGKKRQHAGRTANKVQA